MIHDSLCPQAAEEDGCACSVWIRLGDVDFDPDKDCDRCGCVCDIIETARTDEREKWIDFSHALTGTHTEGCEWWGRDRAYSQYCEDTWCASWVVCGCQS